MLNTTWEVLLLAYLISGWFLRFVMLFIVPRDKQPASATSWLLLIMIEPVIGSVLFAMFGQPSLPKPRRRAQDKVDKLTAKELDELRNKKSYLFQQPRTPELVEAQKLAAALGGLPAMGGNDIKLFTDYEAMLDVQVAAIDKAKTFVHIEYFIMVMDDFTEPFFAAMERAVERGVVVRLLTDRFATAHYPGYRRMKTRLENNGVQWRQMLPYSLVPGEHFTRPDLRNHRKLLIVDGEVAYSGSMNIVQANYHRKDNLVYEEMLLELRGPIVWQCNNVFRSDWYAETKEPLLEIVEDRDLPTPAGDILMQVLPSGPCHDHDNNLMLYATLFYTAKKRISIVVPYFVPDESVMSAIIAAVKRGVEVTIVNSEIIDKLFTGHAQRSYYDDLLDAGVNLYLYKSPVFLHNKQVLIDNEVALVGSSNLDIRSFQLDLELNMIIYDARTVNKLEEVENTYLKRSIRVTKKTWAERPLRLRLLDRLSRLTSALQ